jgi:hypothetical protein
LSAWVPALFLSPSSAARSNGPKRQASRTEFLPKLPLPGSCFSAVSLQSAEPHVTVLGPQRMVASTPRRLHEVRFGSALSACRCIPPQRAQGDDLSTGVCEWLRPRQEVVDTEQSRRAPWDARLEYPGRANVSVRDVWPNKPELPLVQCGMDAGYPCLMPIMPEDLVRLWRGHQQAGPVNLS